MDKTSSDRDESPSTEAGPAAQAGPATVTVRRSALIWAGLGGAVLAAAVVVFGALYVSESGARDDDRAAAADREHAEQLAEDYAVGAATVDFNDLDAWLGRLKQGTSDELAARFDATSPPLREILSPLQWESTANPITATVETEADGVYTVNAFVDVDSTSVQNPDGAQSTVTYSVTIDRNSGWEITDVGGLGGLPGQ